MKFTAYLALLMVIAGLLAGCGGGSKSQSIPTPYHGSISGVETTPPNGDTNVGVDTWIEVCWPHIDAAPPSTFTFKLERERGTGRYETVNTTQETSHPSEGSWWFAPVDDLLCDYTYRITVTDNRGNVYHSFFETELNRTRGVVKPSYRPAGADGKSPSGQSAEEHLVITGK